MTTIGFLYRGSLPDGTVFDDSDGEPHVITVGRAHVMPLLEKALLEMDVGEERTVDIAAKDAYGAYDEEGVQKVPTYKIPNGENMPEGEMILWTSPRNNRPIPVKVTKIVNQVAYLDFNHPLAGKDISYWVKVTSRSDRP
jgi:FKBP-type peptidyl-prolyl cis-trans isomerase 2